MVQTSRKIRITLLRHRPGLDLAYRLSQEGRSLRPLYPSLGAARAAASRRRPRLDTVAVLWPADEYGVAADAVLANDYASILL